MTISEFVFNPFSTHIFKHILMTTWFGNYCSITLQDKLQPNQQASQGSHTIIATQCGRDCQSSHFLPSYLVTCQWSFLWLHLLSSALTFHISLNYIFFWSSVKWRNVVQRLTEVCSVGASQKDKLMGNFVTKVCSLPPTVASVCPMARQTWSEAMLSLSCAKPGRGKTWLMNSVTHFKL